MSRAKPTLRYVTWNEIVEYTVKLSYEILKRYKPDVIIAIAKGGLIPARIVSDVMGVDEIGLIEVKFYKGIGLTVEKPFIKAMSIPVVSDRNVLIVDDVVDSGRTMQLVVNVVSSLRARTVKTFALFTKPWSTFIPDYYYEMTDSWIVFPWEVCEVLKEGFIVDHEEFKRYAKYCTT